MFFRSITCSQPGGQNITWLSWVATCLGHGLSTPFCHKPDEAGGNQGSCHTPAVSHQALQHTPSGFQGGPCSLVLPMLLTSTPHCFRSPPLSPPSPPPTPTTLQHRLTLRAFTWRLTRATAQTSGTSTFATSCATSLSQVGQDQQTQQGCGSWQCVTIVLFVIIGFGSSCVVLHSTAWRWSYCMQSPIWWGYSSHPSHTNANTNTNYCRD